MNQIIVDLLMITKDLNFTTKVASRVAKKALKIAKRNGRSVLIMGAITLTGLYYHDQEVSKLKKRVTELEYKSVNVYNCEDEEETEK